MNDLTIALKQKAYELGFNMVGVVPAVPGRRLDAYLNWIEQSYHGLMGYLARPDRLARRQDLNVILPGVQSLVCVGLDYHTMRVPDEVAADPSRGRISNYAWGVDYHDVMTPRLHALGAWLSAQVAGDVANRVYVDTGAIIERDHAESAGFGFIGKNTMLIGPQHGSWFFLGELLTTVPLTVDTPRLMPGCGSCNRCQVACPTAAFPAPYLLDARRCISYLTIELKGWIPRELRPLIGNWIYGCDICQDVCPFNRFAPQTAVSEFAAHSWDSMAPPLLDLLALDEAGFNARFANSPIKRIRRRRLLRNACVAAGNWGSKTAVPALVNLLTDDEPLIRGHAAWALHQIGDGVGETAVAAALPYELDEDARREMGNL
jgi:epoxyqueuosine reductase